LGEIGQAPEDGLGIMLRMAGLPASEFIRQVRMIGLIIAFGSVSGHPTSARDVDSEPLRASSRAPPATTAERGKNRVSESRQNRRGKG